MSDLRQTLHEMGEGLEPDSSLSVPVRTRVRHRQAVTAFVAALVLTSVGVASVAGVHALSERASRVPANRVTLPPGPAAPVACMNGWHLAPNPVVSGDFQDSLVAASALASDDIWAVGTGFVTSPTGQTVLRRRTIDRSVTRPGMPEGHPLTVFAIPYPVGNIGQDSMAPSRL